MKHCLFGLLFLLIFSQPLLAGIDLTISDLIPKDDHFQLNARVTGMSSSSATYVQAMFSPVDISKYFGFTFSKKGEWLKYGGSPDKQIVLESFIKLENDTNTTIFVKPDYDDADYQGPGKYQLKLKRYTASGSPSDYSNSLEIDLNYTKAIETTPTTLTTPTTTTTTNTPAPTTPPKTPTSTPKVTTPISLPTSANVTSPTADIVSHPQVLSTTSSDINLGTISAIVVESMSATSFLSTPSSDTLSDRTLFLIGATIFVFSGSLLYFRLKNL